VLAVAATGSAARGSSGKTARPGAVNITQGGAKCDGTTDDRAALQAAITANVGQTIYIPDMQTCVVSMFGGAALTIPAGTILRGRGTIKVKDHAGVYNAVLYSTDCTGCRFEEFTIDSNIANNPIANQAEIMTVGQSRIEIFAIAGSNVTVRGVTIKNSSSTNSINLYADKVSVTDCQLVNIGDDPNHVVHDYSGTYLTGSQIIVSGNRFTAAHRQARGAYTAIETHGTTHAVVNNTIVDFTNGLNITGIRSDTVTEASTIANNVISGALQCIELWSSALGGHTTGYGFNGLTVTGNSCRVNQTSYTDTALWGGNTAAWGILVDPNANLPWANAKIASNVIVFDLESTIRAGSASAFGIGWISTGAAQSAENVSIENNTVDNSPLSCIRLDMGGITGMRVTGNTCRNAGSSLDLGIDANYKIPIFVFARHGQLQGEISNNLIVDNLPASRMAYAFLLGGTSGQASDLRVFWNTVSLLGGATASWQGYFDLPNDFAVPLVWMVASGKPWVAPPSQGAMRSGSQVFDTTTGTQFYLHSDGNAWTTQAKSARNVN
jgi:hypothetical protein